METTTANASSLIEHLEKTLSNAARPAFIHSVLPTLLKSIGLIARQLQSSHHVSLAGSSNAFGDDQLNVDVQAENIIRDEISRCPSIVCASSEEDPVEKLVHEQSQSTNHDDTEQYTIAFDPLDGSSIIAPNWTVGTIIGIWDGSSALHQDPSTKQIAGILGVYGPRSTAILAIRLPGRENICIELGLTWKDGTLSYEIIRPKVELLSAPFKTRYFSPANLRAAAEDERYMQLVTHYIREKYTLRYSGGLVPDLVHMLVKGHGIYISPVTGTSKAKLRRLYELAPVALVIECAGATVVDPATGVRVLGTMIEDCDERGGLLVGNSEEVEAVKKHFQV